MFDSFTKHDGDKALLEGMFIGAKSRANKAENLAEKYRSDALSWKENAKEWEEYAKEMEKKLISAVSERDAGLQTISAVIEEIREIDTNPGKERFFSDPENRFSRTNLFKEVAEKREVELKKIAPIAIEDSVLKK